MADLASLQQRAAQIQRQIRLTIESHLQSCGGRSMGTLGENQRWVVAIGSLLDQHGLRAVCPQCGHAAILRVSPRRGIESGVFVFDHTVSGRRTFHGGTSAMPLVRLMAKPQRRPTQ